MTNATNPTNQCYILYIGSQNETDSTSPSRLEIVFLPDNAASVSVINIPAYTMITQVFNVCTQAVNSKLKTLGFTNQS